MFITKLPKITAAMSDIVMVRNAKQVKEHMRETKANLADYAFQMLAATEEELNICWKDVYRIEATYYNSYQMPVLSITGSISNKNKDYQHGFIECHCGDGGPSAYTIYHQDAA